MSAVADAYLVVDGPYCVFQKAEGQAAHDLNQTLISPVGTGRVVHTDVRFNTNVVDSVTLDRGEEIQAVLRPALASLGAVREPGLEDPRADTWEEFLADVVNRQTGYLAARDGSASGSSSRSN